ncbi:fasciclin domain-containing protein [Spirulina sp. CS-785/01]|uniref:fasciclin domain-containing protein n=1 Tax=Spirulina sp. CS-785/01 TaxID=3021716 RepID=UPI0023311C76|nr:fasciclin domain-containing protein [Spirulina sp. CS-785/01]MDB9315779.1 fasciclin domain-containing protein [Spirulina sp. CS-785/01]
MSYKNRQFLPALLGSSLLGLAALMGGTTLAQAESSDPSVQSPDTLLIAQDAPGNIVEVASGSDDFETLVQAVSTAGLADTLSGDGPFTVFAPTDEAFANLPDGVLEALLEPENRELLVDILTYHVVPGEVMAEDLETGGVTTLGDRGLAVRVEPDGVIINNGSVVQADIPAENGVIHGVNRVFIPEDLKDEVASLATPIRGLW